MEMTMVDPSHSGVFRSHPCSMPLPDQWLLIRNVWDRVQQLTDSLLMAEVDIKHLDALQLNPQKPQSECLHSLLEVPHTNTRMTGGWGCTGTGWWQDEGLVSRIDAVCIASPAVGNFRYH
jgi:hypothetical protein